MQKKRIALTISWLSGTLAVLGILWLLRGSTPGSPAIALAADLPGRDAAGRVAASPPQSAAATYTVCPAGPPDCDYSMVQEAVHPAGDGDLIQVATGIYTDVHFLGGYNQVVYLTESLTIRGGYSPDFQAWDPQAYPTTLDAGEQGRVVHITGNVSPTLESLRLTNGLIGDLGGGVFAINAHPVISGCLVYSNTASNGGGIQIYQGDNAVLINNIVQHNRADPGNGGGVFIWGSQNVRLENNIVTDNQVLGLASTGPGINFAGFGPAVSTGELFHTTVARNQGGGGHGLYVTGGSDITATNTILVSQTIGILVLGGGSPSTATLTATLWGAGSWANETDWIVDGTLVTGTINLWEEPEFVDPDGDDYHITGYSGAVDAGVPTSVDVDIDGQPRPIGPAPDLGADEFLPPLLTGVQVSGPAQGLVDAGLIFTATVSPLTATGSITYRWEALGLTPVTHTSGVTDLVTFTWPTPGTQAITVTASNPRGAVSDSHTVLISDAPIAGLLATNDSPTPLGALTNLTATISAGTNVMYTWDFGDDTSGTGSIVAHTYTDVGVYTALVTATNSANLVTATTAVTVTAPSFDLYLPLIQIR